MIRATLHDPAEPVLLEGGAELVEVWRQRPASHLWLMIEAEDPDGERRLLRDQFDIHPLALTDAFRDRHPPKIEEFEDFTFLLIKGLAPDEPQSLEIETIQIAIFLGERFLITRSTGRSVSTEGTLAELQHGELPPDVSRARLALRLCRRVADRFLPLLLKVEDRLEEMEQELLQSPTDQLLAELVQQKSDLRQMLRLLQYQAQVFTQARQSTPRQLEGVRHELLDVQEHLDRHLSMARLYFELSGDLMDGYLSLSSHRLNQIMQTLTIVTVVFVPVTFLAGIYGMNFEYMPELSRSWAYFAVLGVMFLIIVGILAFFRWRGWMGTAGGVDRRDGS